MWHEVKKNPKPGYKLVETIFGKTEEIPKDWSFRKLSEIGEIVGGGTPDTTNSDYWNNGTITWYTPADFTKFEEDVISESGRKITEIAVDESATKKIPPGAILITTRATIGECKIIEKESTVNQGIHNLICHDDKTKYFVLYAIRFHKNRLLRLASGTTFPEITRGNMREISIPIPDEPNERKKIGEILQNTSNLIFRTQKLIEQTTVYKQSLIQKLFIKGVGDTKPKKMDWYFGMKIEIPEEWDIKPLGEIAKLSAGGTPSTSSKEYWENGTIPWLTSGEINFNRITSAEHKITKLGLDNSAAKIFPENTVLIALTGFGMTRGRSSYLEIKSATNQSVVGIIPKKEIVDSEYLWQYLMKQYQLVRSFAQGTQQPGLNLELLNEFKIIHPKDPEKGREIASILSNVDKKIEKEKQFKKQAQSYHRALMQKLLTGEKRVKF